MASKSLAEQMRGIHFRTEAELESDRAARAPYISPELIDFLNTSYPNRCPSISTPERQIWHDVGARSVVDHLIRLHSEQVKKDLTSS